MSLVLAAATAALMVQPTCSWDKPGVDRYRGTPAAALANYRDIPAADRALLAQRISSGNADDHVQIGRTSIAGTHQYESNIADMHFGKSRMCRTVTRSKWKAAHREPAAVYCVNDECVLVPEVCGNVSRVRRIVTSGGSETGATGSSGPAPGVPVVLLPEAAPPPMPVYGLVPTREEPLPTRLSGGAPFPQIPLPGYPGPGRDTFTPVPVSPVPEPSTWAMLLGGVAMVAGRLWRRNRKASQV